MAERLFRVATFAAATVVYKAERTLRRPASEIKNCPRCHQEALRKSRIETAIVETREKIMRLRNEVGAPAIVIGVSVDGNVIWKEGIGLSDIENEVPANEDTVMRIASISKSLTAAVVGRLWQEGVIDLNQPIQKYVPLFPEKTYGGTEVTITTKQLMCHLSGIRHYSKMKEKEKAGAGDGQFQEFYGKEKYETVQKSLSIFKDDELINYPGTKYLYSTYGWTVVSAVMEGATGKTYPQLMRSFLRDMGMRRTYLDEHEPIIYGRSRYYCKNKNGRIINSPFVDNSCKWAGGGFLSTVGDLLKFANAMLYAYQFGGSIDVSKAKQEVGVVKKKIQLKIKMPWKKDEVKVDVKERNDVNVDDNSMQLSSKTEGAEGSRNNVKVKDNIVQPSSEKKGAESDGGGASSPHLQSAQSDSSSSTIDTLKVVGGIAGTAVKIVGEGVASVGIFVWKSMQSRYEKEKPADNAKETGPSTVDHVKEVGSTAGAAVKSVGQGVASVGSYAWDSMRSLYGKQEEGDSSDNENTVSKVDRIKEVGSTAGAAVKSVGQGVASVGSYAWDSMRSLYGKQEEGDSSDNENTVSKVDRIKEVGSTAGTAVKSVGQGVASVGSYAWDSMRSLYGKQEGDSSDNENTVSKVDRIKEIGGSAGSAVKGVGQGVYSAGSDIWGKVSSGHVSEKDQQSGSSNMKNNKKDMDSSEQENQSWANFKNIFRPKAANSFNIIDFNHQVLSNEKFSSCSPMDGKVYHGMVLNTVIPYAVKFVAGLKYPGMSDGRAGFIKDHSGDEYRENEMEPNSQFLAGLKYPGISDGRAEFIKDDSGDEYRENEMEPISQLCKLHSAAMNDQQENTHKSMNSPYMSQKTVASLWTRVENTKFSDWGPCVEGGYGLGFGVAPAVDCPGGVVEGGQPFMIGHTGGAVGASSAFIVMPRDCDGGSPPKGVAVVILTNLQSVNLNPLAIEITRIFANATQ